jgi:hypothetical protein
MSKLQEFADKYKYTRIECTLPANEKDKYNYELLLKGAPSNLIISASSNGSILSVKLEKELSSIDPEQMKDLVDVGNVQEHLESTTAQRWRKIAHAGKYNRITISHGDKVTFIKDRDEDFYNAPMTPIHLIVFLNSDDSIRTMQKKRMYDEPVPWELTIQEMKALTE